MSKEMDNFKAAMGAALQSVMSLENSNEQLRDLNKQYKAQIINLRDDYTALAKSDQTAALHDQLAIMTARATTAEAQLTALRKLLGVAQVHDEVQYGTGAGEIARAMADAGLVEHSK